MSISSFIHTRARQEVAQARIAVRKYFGLAPEIYHGNGSVYLIKPFETKEKKLKEHFWEEDKAPKQRTRLQKAVEKLFWLRESIGPVAYCDLLEPAPELHFKLSYLLFATKRTRLGLSAHEITHSFQKETKLMKEKTGDRSIIEAYSAQCAMEGLAVLAEKNIKKQIPEGFFSKLVEKAYKLVIIPVVYLVRPEALIKKIITRLTMMINKNKKEQLAEKVDGNPKLAKWLWPYSSGLTFAEKVAEKLGPRIAFRLICDSPPESMTELLFPERYLENVGKYVETAKQKVTGTLDTFLQRTGIIL